MPVSMKDVTKVMNRPKGKDGYIMYITQAGLYYYFK